MCSNSETFDRRYSSKPATGNAVSQSPMPSYHDATASNQYDSHLGGAFQMVVPPFGSSPADAFAQPMMGSSDMQSSIASSYAYAAPLGNKAEDSWAGFNPSRSLSPASFTLSPFMVPWSEFEPQSIFDMRSHPASDSTAPTSVSSPSLNGMSAVEPARPENLSLIDLDEQDRARIIECDVASLSAMTTDPIGHATFWLLEDRYLPLFWDSFYPSFPVIHRPTFFSSTQVPILLKTLMVAAGASFGKDADSRLVAQTLMRTCDELMKRRAPLAPESSIWELHVTFLNEALQLYRSQKPTRTPSDRFGALSSMVGPSLQHESHAPLADVLQFQFDPAVSMDEMSLYISTEDASLKHQTWVAQETKRRLQLACYVLETQQATLFERRRDIIYGDMPMPCSSDLWETQDLLEWQTLLLQQGGQVKYLYDIIDQVPTMPYDSFTSAVVVASTSGNKFTVVSPTVVQAISADPKGEFCHHSTQLASHTPIRQLLATAAHASTRGEEQLSLLPEVEEAKQVIRVWTRTESVSKAMYHAIHLLRTSHERGTIGVLYEEWTLYLAALVCFATGMWQQRNQPLSRESSPLADLNTQMMCFLARFDVETAGKSDLGSLISDYEGTRACLSWTRERISGTTGGLIEDAVRTLARLANQPC